MDYKIGDRVRIIRSKDAYLVGITGLITHVNDQMVAVAFDGGRNKECVWLEPKQIERVDDSRTLTEYEEYFFALTNEMRHTFVDKNRDYGSSFADTIRKFGYPTAVARIHDKYMRVENMVLGQEMMVNETMRDNLMDIANYCLLTVMELDRDKLQTKDFEG